MQKSARRLFSLKITESKSWIYRLRHSVMNPMKFCDVFAAVTKIKLTFSKYYSFNFLLYRVLISCKIILVPKYFDKRFCCFEKKTTLERKRKQQKTPIRISMVVIML